MANIKSSLKDMRRISRRTERNRQERSKLKTLRRNALAAAQGEDTAAAREAARKYVAAVDKAVKHGVLHKNRADHAKSAFSQQLFGTAA